MGEMLSLLSEDLGEKNVMTLFVKQPRPKYFEIFVFKEINVFKGKFLFKLLSSPLQSYFSMWPQSVLN